MFNSASLPVASKKVANAKAKENFSALFEYGNGERVSLRFDSALEKILLSETESYSLTDFLDDLQRTDIELAAALTELIDFGNTIVCSAVEYYTLKIGDDTRFNKCNCIKYACINDFMLFSVTDNHFWERKEIDCSIYYENECNHYKLYNLFSNDISHLPKETPSFTLKDSKRFVSTGKHKNGAVVYKEMQTGYYWYKDTFHTSESEHYEVFDSTGKRHLGEAGIDGILDASKADRTKRINDLL